MSLDLESLALKVTLRIYEALEGKGEKVKAEALVRRAKDLPSLVKQAGLFQSIALYLSKVDSEKNYENIYKIVSGVVGEEYRKSLKSDKEGEGKGYATLLAVLSYAISAVMKGKLRECEDLSNIKSLAQCALQLKESNLLLSIESQLTPYLITVKRMFEALFTD